MVYRAEGEHSYHIFYQLCEGADPFLRGKVSLQKLDAGTSQAFLMSLHVFSREVKLKGSNGI